MTRDILMEIANGTTTPDEAEDAVEDLVGSQHDGKIPETFGLSQTEWAAYVHGVGLEEIARWRQHGWPSECPVCGRVVVPSDSGWIPKGTSLKHRLVHISCLSAYAKLS
jgi:hypothetical protein